MDTPESPPPIPPPPSNLPVVSLACGILGILTGPVTGIPAIVTGHIARGRIKRAKIPMKKWDAATAGMILGYVTTFLGLWAAAGMVCGTTAVSRAKRVTSLATATAIEAATNNFFAEYGSMPADGEKDVILSTGHDTAFLQVLLGIEDRKSTALNTRSVRFLMVKEGRNGKNGLIYSADGKSVTGLFDPWGGPYHVALDLDSDEKLSVPTMGGRTLTLTLTGRRVAVWSDGPDRKPGADDDAITW